MNTPLRLLFLPLVLLALAGRCGPATAADDASLPPDVLKADPWVTPPRTIEETKTRVAELKTRYAAFLRSLPPKLSPRRYRELAGSWRSKFEVTDSVDGRRPDAPDWFREDFDDSAWEKTSVPEWRWSPIKRENRWYPASCILGYRTRFDALPAPPGRRVFLCFAGVDWEAEVWLNGTFLGRHKVYYEPFRFDVARLLKDRNTLAVRVIDGPAFGEPMSQWSLLPFVPGDPGKSQRYVLGDRQKSFPGDEFGTTSSLGSGFGIHREVYLETTAAARVAEVFVRATPAGQANVIVETDSASATDLTLEARILPENFDGPAYDKTERVRLPKGAGKQTIAVSMPGAKLWWPAEPYLYRCRVTLRDGQQLVDSHDALFGCRRFGVVSAGHPRPGSPEGTFLLNGRPLFLRGTNLSGVLNAYWYWRQHDKLLEAILLLKAANFNIVRACQHVSFPEVREMLDRMGMMSEQDQGSGFELGHDVSAGVAEAGTALARVCYNNPGVVLLSFANETRIDATAAVRNALAVDPERILVPVSGGTFTLNNPRHRENVVIDHHPYEGWYGGVHQLWDSARTRPPVRLCTMGEYGAEALDAYETMRNHYPQHWGPTPSPTEDKLWGARQTGKGNDYRQQFGFRGKKPANLAEYIEASQNYQADVLAEGTKGFRLSKRAVGGYFQFHFLDGTAAQWPKSIVSHDFRPKKGYFEMAQINQPLVPLYRLADQGKAMEIWVVNDLAVRLPGVKVCWHVEAAGHCVAGEAAIDIPQSDALLCKKLDLAPIPADCEVLRVSLVVSDVDGKTLSRYQREVYRSFKFVISDSQRAKGESLRRTIGRKGNIALHKPVVASSARDDAGPALAVDGGTRTGWTARDNSLPQSLTVDLGQRIAIAGARVIWQGDADRQIEIHLSDDGQQWRLASEKMQTATVLVPRAPLMFLDQFMAFGGEGRYVRITINKVSDGGPAGFNELEIYPK